MDYKNIIVERKGTKNNIVVMTMNRPKVLNALSIETLGEINAMLAEIEKDSSVRGLILTGGDCRAFIAGADLNECKDAFIEENRNYCILGQSLTARLEALPIPVIAAVNGYALGGGCEICLACDIRIASEKAKFGTPEANLGVIPGFGATQRLPKLVGAGMAKEMLYTCRQVTAAEAKEIGLVNKVVPAEELMSAAMEMMELIATKSGTAIKYDKIAVNHGMDLALANGLELERNLSAICYGLPEKAEGVSAFLEKRTPNF